VHVFIFTVRNANDTQIRWNQEKQQLLRNRSAYQVLNLDAPRVVRYLSVLITCHMLRVNLLGVQDCFSLTWDVAEAFKFRIKAILKQKFSKGTKIAPESL
jgi:hypothetical protein